jgi:hypothetical protein
MTKEEYYQKKEALEEKYKHDVDMLAIKYARSNQKFFIGDVIQNRYTKRTILIEEEKVTWSGAEGIAEMAYVGHLFNKKMKERSRYECIFESDAELLMDKTQRSK